MTRVGEPRRPGAVGEDDRVAMVGRRTLDGMSRCVRAISVLAAVLLVPGCSGGPTTPVDSGVEGRTVVDGGCPTTSSASPCPDVPLAAKITVTRSSDRRVVATTQSGQDGRYRISLAPGGYALRAENLTGNALPRGATAGVQVDQGQYENVVLKFDSGVRGSQPGG